MMVMINLIKENKIQLILRLVEFFCILLATQQEKWYINYIIKFILNEAKPKDIQVIKQGI